MEGFLQKLDNMIGADKTGLTSAPLVDMRNALTEREAVPATATTPAQPRAPITDIENLDNARKYFRDLPAQPAYVQKALPKFVGSRVTSLAKELGSIMETHSPEFAQGKQLYRDITGNTFNPRRGPPPDNWLPQRNILNKLRSCLLQTHSLAAKGRWDRQSGKSPSVIQRRRLSWCGCTWSRHSMRRPRTTYRAPISSAALNSVAVVASVIHSRPRTLRRRFVPCKMAM